MSSRKLVTLNGEPWGVTDGTLEDVAVGIGKLVGVGPFLAATRDIPGGVSAEVFFKVRVYEPPEDGEGT